MSLACGYSSSVAVGDCEVIDQEAQFFLNKLFETIKKKLLTVVNFKRSSEDYLKSSRCNWRRSMLFILNCCIDTAELYRTLVETLLESDKSSIEFVFPLGVSVKP